MNNAARHEGIDPKSHRGQMLESMLRRERWTGRQVALAIGVSPTSVHARFRGEVDLTFTDIERIAPLIRMTGIELYAALADAEMAPTPKGEGHVLPEMDSNHQPADVQPDAIITPLRPRTSEPVEHDRLASVTTLRVAS